MPSSKYYQKYKTMKRFPELCPLWFDRIKHEGLDRLAEPTTLDNKYLNIGSAPYCIVGEAHKFTSNYVEQCIICADFANDFQDVIENAERLVLHQLQTRYHFHKVQEAKVTFNSLKRRFVEHMNRDHKHELR